MNATLYPILKSNSATFEPRRAAARPSNRGSDRCLESEFTNIAPGP